VDDERLIFFFDDGCGKRRAVDPFDVERALRRGLEGEPLARAVQAARSGVPALADPAVERLDAAAAAAFTMPPVAPDGSGFTVRARARVLGEFLRWRSEVKKNTNSKPTSPPATANPPGSPTRPATRSG
jgi:hypothetical protein